MEQAVAVVVYERRWVSPGCYQCRADLARPGVDLERCLASLMVEGERMVFVSVSECAM